MNYFEYFTEIEDLFSRRRGSILLLSTLDWALIETWRDAGIPLEAVLRGIDNAFDKHDARATRAGARTRKVNGLAWCAQAVLQAAEEAVEASTGLAANTPREPATSGFEANRIATFLDRNAEALEAAIKPGAPQPALSPPKGLASEMWPFTSAGAPHLASELWVSTAASTFQRLRELAAAMRSESPIPLDDLDRTLTVLEEKLFAVLQSTATEEELVSLKTQADRELAPYRAKMSAVQLRQVQQQFLHKRLLELRRIPRLSLFYMGLGE
jgi:hypothetical protein